MLPVVTADEMRALDAATISEIGIPALTLMEIAGRGVAEVALRMLGTQRGHVAVVCGPGNNGGDGFVIARVLRDRGVDAVAYLAVPRAAVKGDALAHLGILERAGGVVRSIATAAELAEVAGLISGAALAVDALFGIGPLRAIEGHLAEVVARINAAPLRLAVDLPSGLDADTGAVLGAVVEADRTATMGARKVALVSAPGFARCGAIEVVDIGIPTGVLATAAVRAGLVEESDVVQWLPRPRPLDHKGTRGHVLVIGGAPEMRGAGRLAAGAALRAGAGLVTLAGDGEVTAPDSVMTHSLEANGGDALAGAIEGKSAIVIGPGLGTSDVAARRVATILGAGIPAVLDADALNVLAAEPSVIARAAGPVVITPHPGEAGRLLGITTLEVEADRLGAARALASVTGAVVVLKGARTLVVDGTLGDDHCAINPTGGPALATAGSGDVLAGTIGALLAQGLSAGDAARAAVFVHGRAGEALEAVQGRGVVSSDLALAIASAIRQLAR